MLTAKREAFAIALSQGLSQADAYRAAFNSDRMSAAAIYNEGSKLAKNPEIAMRVAELRAPAIANVQITAEMVARRAWEIATNRDNGPAVMALTLLAKMFPEFSEKHEFTGDVRLRVEALQAVASMTPEQLIAIAEQARGA